MTSISLRRLQFAIFLLVPIINFGSNLLYDSPFSDDAEVLIQPAGYAFAIWGPIFLGMIIYSWYQMQSARVESTHLTAATKAGILAGLASIAFVPISHSDLQWLGFINIIWHLLALIWLFVSLRRQITLENNPATHWYFMPTQMYLGWISAATAISTALLLTEVGVQPALEIQVIITAVVIGALVIIGMLMAYNRGMVVPLVFIWALAALIVERGEYPIIKYTSIVAIIILAVVTLPQIVKRKRLAF